MKRFLDVLLSLLAIIFLSPLMLIISLIIICDDGLPVIFRQNRVGKGDELFKIKKFRTMKNGAPNLSTADFEQSDEFITRSGKFLRRTSLSGTRPIMRVSWPYLFILRLLLARLRGGRRAEKGLFVSPYNNVNRCRSCADTNGRAGVSFPRRPR